MFAGWLSTRGEDQPQLQGGAIWWEHWFSFSLQTDIVGNITSIGRARLSNGVIGWIFNWKRWIGMLLGNGHGVLLPDREQEKLCGRYFIAARGQQANFDTWNQSQENASIVVFRRRWKATSSHPLILLKRFGNEYLTARWAVIFRLSL